ncbi:acyltransferase [Streptomyces sp. NBC_01142]|uniref:acyltransferase family protein n=1 Tax=Streptomyces sp. NBC_01142 TaxID=2975865 RepID=UPI0022521259|nr:acyltransferase [Streptomyces sp. NBC_01142]MCX4820921.1 acyltransferase [Streptomyces sp. NBC_01142]
MQEKPPTLPSLTGLRWALAFIALLAHALVAPNFFTGTLKTLALMTLPPGTAAMSGFFVLSGFLLTWKHRPGHGARAFWRRRFWKIFPNHVLCLGIVVAIYVFVTPRPLPDLVGENSLRAAVLQLFLVQNWIPDWRVIGSFNIPAWSLSCEAFFYAMFPLLIIAVRKIPDSRLRHAWWVLAATTLVMPLVPVAMHGLVYGDPLGLDDNSLWFSYFLPPVRLPEFAIGVVTARLVQTGRWPRLSRTAITVPLVVSVALMPVLPLQCLFGGTFTAPVALVVAAVALADIDGRTGRLARPVPMALGESSYALYLVQTPILMIGLYLLGANRAYSLWESVLLTLAYMVISVLIGLVVYRYVEAPLVRRWSEPRRPRTHLDTPTKLAPSPVAAEDLR